MLPEFKYFIFNLPIHYACRCDILRIHVICVRNVAGTWLAEGITFVFSTRELFQRKKIKLCNSCHGAAKRVTRDYDFMCRKFRPQISDACNDLGDGFFFINFNSPKMKKKNV